MDDGEDCDDGDLEDGDGCDHNCKPTGCHNGVRTPEEECDDGNLNDDDACVGDCVNAGCGDGFIQVEKENCDDGNAVTEECNRGETSCMVCDETCHMAEGATSFCGDGVVQLLHEKCDDGNNHICGTCNSDCDKITSAFATGQIAVLKANDIGNGDYFTLGDGTSPAVTFTFRKPPPEMSLPGDIVLNDFDNATTVRNKTAEAINNYHLYFNLKLEASHPTGPGSIVNLKNSFPTESGNVGIGKGVNDDDFTVSGMSGGQGGNCGLGVGCMVNEDCLSNKCEMNLCK